MLLAGGGYKSLLDIGKDGWINAGAQSPVKHYKMGTITLSGSWLAVFEVEATGDWNYCNYAHGKLIISCYSSGSCSVTLLTGPDYAEKISAYIDSSLNIWLRHE
jgi:hypothetical protein